MLFTMLLAASSAICPVEKAEYKLRGAEGVSARFHAVKRTPDWPSGLALQVQVAGSGRSYWFLPWQGGTDGKTNLAWVKERRSPIQFQEVRRDIEFFAADESYGIVSEIPQAGLMAPARIFIPGLGRLAWFSTTDQNRDSIPRAFFDFATCRTRSERPPEIEFPAVP